MTRQWNIISVPYFPPNFQQTLTFERSKVLGGNDEDLNLSGCHKSTGQQFYILEEHTASTFKV